MTSPSATPSPARLRALLCLGVGVSAALAFWLLRQQWLYGDGAAMVRVVARAGEQGALPVWRHTLYLPLCAGMQRLFDSLRPDEACRAVSALSGGALVAACLWLCLERDTPSSAGLSAALVATSPAVWFFATTVEVHALHGASVAVAMLVLTRMRGRWRAATVALGPALFFLAHESSWLLLPGWVVFAARGDAGQKGQARPLATAAVLASAGAALGIAGAALLRARGFGAGSLSAVSLVERLGSSAPQPQLLWSGVLGPLLGLSLLAALALRRGGLLLAAFWLPHALFTVFVFGDPNAGGYLLPVVAALSLAASRTLAVKPRTRWLVAPLLLVQVAQIHSLAADPGQAGAGELRARRAAAARAALPDGGLLVCADFSLQTVEGLAPGVKELNVWREVARAVDAGEAPDAFAARLAATLEQVGERRPRIAFDLSYRAKLADYREALELVDALALRIQERFPGRILTVDGLRVFQSANGP